jgi:hypothetical protein
MSRVMRSRWMLPALCVVIGLAYLVAAGIGHQLELGAEMFGVTVVFAIGLIFGRRSETVRGFTQADARDERFAALDLRATAVAGTVVVIAILIAFMVSLARGDSGEPYVWLGTLAGLAYLIALGVLRARS